MKQTLSVLCLAALSLNAGAANLSVTPTRIILSEKANTASLSFTNRSDHPVSLQIFMKAWDQDGNGQSVLADSREVVVFPKMLVIEPGQERPVRLGFQGQWPENEATFRVFADELPSAKIEEGSTGVVFPVRISVPVFVRKQAEASTPEMQLTGAEIRGGKLRVGIRNTGRQSFSVSPLAAEVFDAGGKSLAVVEDQGWHVLAGHQVHFSLPLKKPVCERASAVEIRATADQVSEHGRFPLPEKDCQAEQ